MVNARPVHQRSSDAYRWGNFKINSDRIAWDTENTTTATMNPDTDSETPGTTHAATSSPIAHDPRSTTARSRIWLTAISVGVGAVAGKNRPCTLTHDLVEQRPARRGGRPVARLDHRPPEQRVVPFRHRHNAGRCSLVPLSFGLSRWVSWHALICLRRFH